MVAEQELHSIITNTEVSRLRMRDSEFSSEYLIANLSLAQLEFRQLKGEPARRFVTAAISELSRLPANDKRRHEYDQMVDKATRDLSAVLCAPFHPVIYVDGRGVVPLETHNSPSYTRPATTGWGGRVRDDFPN